MKYIATFERNYLRHLKRAHAIRAIVRRNAKTSATNTIRREVK